MNRWRTAALIWLASGLVLFPHTVAGQQASEVTRLLQPNHQTKFSALLDGGLSRWDKSYLVTYGFNGTPDASLVSHRSSPTTELAMSSARQRYG